LLGLRRLDVVDLAWFRRDILRVLVEIRVLVVVLKLRRMCDIGLWRRDIELLRWGRWFVCIYVDGVVNIYILWFWWGWWHWRWG